MAASDRWQIEVKGEGGHGAVPQGTVDAVLVGAELVTALHTIVSRNMSPLDSAVLTVGTINGGFSGNIIADSCVLTGTARTYLESTQVLCDLPVHLVLLTCVVVRAKDDIMNAPVYGAEHI